MDSVMKKKMRTRKIKAGTILFCFLFVLGGMPVYAGETEESADEDDDKKDKKKDKKKNKKSDDDVQEADIEEE